MDKDGLKYGWHREAFILNEVNIQKQITLEKNEDGKWSEHEPRSFKYIFADTDEQRKEIDSAYEQINDFRYSKSKRVLTANAQLSSSARSTVCLIDPEKASDEDINKSVIGKFSLNISEAESNNISDCVKSGHIGFVEGVSELGLGGYPYVQFYLTSAHFDDLEQILNQQGASIQISVNRKGWYWIGPIGNSVIFLNPEKTESAELAEISVRKEISKMHADEMENDTFSKEMQEKEFLRYTSKRLTSVSIASWITALGVLYLVVSSYF
ncbi:MAG: hypothetical protein ABW118_10555 [Candidatus Thiodiazotropha sp.]